MIKHEQSNSKGGIFSEILFLSSRAVVFTILASVLHSSKNGKWNGLNCASALAVDSTNKCSNTYKPIQKGYIQ